jgi:hypothetical protein
VSSAPSSRRTDDGSVTAFAVLASICLSVLLGLVAEGGAALGAREAAMSEAEQAARVGAAQLSPAIAHAGGLVDGGESSVNAAEFVMAAAGHPGTASVSGRTVTARVARFYVSTPLLAFAGLPRLPVSASAAATAVDG